MTITEISDGLVAAINAAGLSLTTVRAIASRDFSDDGDFIVLPPAALVTFDGSDLSSGDLQSRTYRWTSRWLIFVVAEDLSGTDKAARGAYGFLDGLKQALGGIDIAGASGKARIVLNNEQLQDVVAGKVVYSLAVTADTHFQVS